MKVLFILLSVFAFVLNIESQNKKKQPDWIQNYPVLENDYVGIASVSKTNANYKELAKQNALNNLSNSISVNVSVVSVFAQNETNKKFTEEYNEVTKTQTKNYIEGYQIEDEWEDKKVYWVFIKVNKKQFLENKERKKQEVTTQAFDLYKSGLNHDKASEIQLALLNYARALSLLSPFLSESIVVNDDGKSLFLANEIINQITKLFKEVNIKMANTSIKTNRGKELNNVELIAYRGTTNLSYIPIKIETKDAHVIGENHQSNKEGKCFFTTSQFVQTDKSNYYISCNVDFESLLKEATKDNLILNLFADISPNILSIKVENSNSFIPNTNFNTDFSFPSTTSIPDIQSRNNKSNENEIKVTNFNELCTAIKSKVSSNQVEIIKFNAPNLPINSKELATLISLISFDEYKLDVIKLYLPYLIDKPKNLYKLLSNQLVFDNAKQELLKILNQP